MSSTATEEEPTGTLTFAKKMMSMNTPVAKEWLSQRRKSVRPWSDFVNTKMFITPKGVKNWSARAVKNIEHYQTNYLFVFIVLIVYCIVTSPLMLIAIAVFLGGCYIIHVKNEQQKVKILGHELSYAQQYGVAAALSFPLFFVAGAGAAVFWVLGVSFFLVALHASFHLSPEEINTEEPFVETV